MLVSFTCSSNTRFGLNTAVVNEFWSLKLPNGAAPKGTERAKSPTDPMSFPPGLIPELVRQKLETDPPYSPLSTLDVDRMGLPEPSQPDAYLRARLDKFNAELKVSHSTHFTRHAGPALYQCLPWKPHRRAGLHGVRHTPDIDRSNGLVSGNMFCIMTCLAGVVGLMVIPMRRHGFLRDVLKLPCCEHCWHL